MSNLPRGNFVLGLSILNPNLLLTGSVYIHTRNAKLDMCKTLLLDMLQKHWVLSLGETGYAVANS